MKKVFYSIAVLGGLAIYAFSQNQNITAGSGQNLQPNFALNTSSLSSTPTIVSTDSSTVNTTTTSGATATTNKSTPSTPVTTKTTPGSAGSTPPPTPTTSMYKNGSFTGSVENASYGNIQVAAIISGGKITNVQILQYPNDRRNSISVNSYALPILISEAIQSQNANVNAVSGATHSSEAFVLSLQSALAQAKS